MVRPAFSSSRRCWRPAPFAREGQVRAALRGRDGRVVDREVAHVQLVDRLVHGPTTGCFAFSHCFGRNAWSARSTSTERVEFERQRHRVRVGDLVDLDLVGRRRVDRDLPEVLRARSTTSCRRPSRSRPSRASAATRCRVGRRRRSRPAGRRSARSAPRGPATARPASRWRRARACRPWPRTGRRGRPGSARRSRPGRVSPSAWVTSSAPRRRSCARCDDASTCSAR